MRELALQYIAFDRFDYCHPHAGLSVTPVVDPRLGSRSFADVKESENADEGEHAWIELGGEG